MMKFNTPQLLAALFAVGAAAFAPSALSHVEDGPRGEAAIQNTPADTSEPTLDDLLGLDDNPPDNAPDQPDQPDENPGDASNPELTRELDRRLTGQEAATQFAQAIQEMEEVAIRLADENDPGIDTQRMQDEIILKLEQIISSAEKQKSTSQKPKPGQPQDGPPRQADQGGKPKPGQKPGDKPGEQQGQKPGEKPGDQQGQKPGEKPGDQQGQKPGDQQGNQNNPNASESGDTGRQGSLQNEELSMKDLREGEWGNLPPRLRDELAQSLSEAFNPVYRAATEAFYRRIAELSKQQAEGE